MRQEKGFKFCLASKNNGALPLDLAKPEQLSAHPSVYPRQSGKKRGSGPVMKTRLLYYFLKYEGNLVAGDDSAFQSGYTRGLNSSAPAFSMTLSNMPILGWVDVSMTITRVTNEVRKSTLTPYYTYMPIY
jgi:hypothetical protein